MVVLGGEDAFEEGHIVFTGFIELVAQLGDGFEVVDGVTELVLTEVAVGAKGVY